VLTVVTALIADLLVLPAALAFFQPFRRRRGSERG